MQCAHFLVPNLERERHCKWDFDDDLFRVFSDILPLIYYHCPVQCPALPGSNVIAADNHIYSFVRKDIVQHLQLRSEPKNINVWTWSQLEVIRSIITQTSYTRDALALMFNNPFTWTQKYFCLEQHLTDQPLIRRSERYLLLARCFVLTVAWSDPPPPPPSSFGCDWEEENGCQISIYCLC